MIANMCFGFLLETQGSYCCLWLSVSPNHSLLGVERDTGWLLYAWPVPELICQQLLCATVRRTRVYGSFHTVPLQLVLLPRSSNYLLHSSMCTPNKTVPASLLLCHHLSKYIKCTILKGATQGACCSELTAVLGTHPKPDPTWASPLLLPASCEQATEESGSWFFAAYRADLEGHQY